MSDEERSRRPAASARRGWARPVWTASVVLLVAAAAACAWWRIRSPAPPGPRAAQVDAIRESIIRWQIANHGTPGGTCFVTVSSRAEENRTFALRLRDLGFVKPLTDGEARSPHPPMLPYSRAANGFADAATGAPAVRFWVGEIDWTSNRAVEARGGGARAMQSGNEGVFRVEWLDGRWQVTGYTVGAMF